jgi:translocation and assembly module TamB
VSDETPNSNRKRKVIRHAVIGLLTLALFVFGAWYLTSPQFHEFARKRLVRELEDVTGGRVEVGSLRWNLSKLEFDVSNVTIHGLEGPDEVPYAHADRLLIRAKILSVFGREIGLRSLQIERPVFHFIVYPDGHTNQPTPKVIAKHEGSPVQRIFELAINHAEVNDGQLILHDRKIPLDFAADKVKAVMDYVAADHRYGGTVKFGSLKTKFSNFLPADADAEVQYQLFNDGMEIPAFHLVTQKSKIDGSAKLTSFTHPVLDVTYRATVDGKELARVTRTPELRAGTFDLTGAAKFINGGLTSKGKVVVHDGDYRIPALRLTNVDAAADFVFDPRKLTFTHVVGRVFGGIVKGDIDVDEWIPSTDPKAPQQTGVARLRVDNVPVRIAADAFSTRHLDFGRLNLAGTAQGTVNAHWRGSLRRTIANLDLQAVPPASPQPGQLPLTGDLSGSYDAGTERLRMAPLNLATPDLRVNAVGVLGSNSEQVRLVVAANDLTKLQPVLAMVHEQDTTAAQLSGKLDFDGVVSGKLTSPSIQGRVTVENFELPLAAVMPAPNQTAARTQLQPKRLRVDSGSGEIAFNQQGVIVRHGVVRRAGSQANLDLSAALTNGVLTDTSRVVAHLIVRDAALADLQQIAGYNYPVSGMVSANLNISGTKLSPEGGGRVQLVNGSIYGEPVKSASADVQFAGQEARIRNFLMVHNGAQVTGSGDYNLNTTAFRFQMVGSNFQLATIHHLQNNRASLSGLLNFNATGSGSTQNPIINASAHLHNMVVNRQRIGDATLTGITQGDQLKLTARTNFQTAELTLDGTVGVHDPQFPANLSVRFTNFDFMPYLQPLLQGRVNARSFSAGTLIVQGPLRNPKQLTIKAEIPKLTAEMQGIELHNSEPIQLSLANETVRVDSFKMVGPDTEMDLRGTVHVTDDNRVRLRAEGRMNLKLAQSFNSDINSSGFADFNVSIAGVITKPTVQGEVRITNGALNLIDFPNGLSNVNGSLVFTEDRVQVQSLTAHTGGGDIRIGGFATYSPRLTFNLTAQGQDIRLRYPQGISSTADMDLKLTGSGSNATLSGDVTITRFGLNSQFDLANYLAKSNRPIETPGASLMNNLHFNVHVTSTPELQVQSSLAKLAGNVDLRLRGTGTNPVLLGRVNVTEGQVSFNGTNYRLERGDVTFNNPTRTEPSIDVEATTRVRDYDITLGFHGQLTHGLNTNYRSDPPLPQADIINLLAFGRTREETEMVSQSGGTSDSGVVGNAILGQALTSAVGDRVQKLFGVSRVKIAPDVASTQTNPTAQVTIEQTVSNKVTITYITNLAQSSQQSIFVEYSINPQLSLIAGRDQYGVVSFDVRIRQRKR